MARISLRLLGGFHAQLGSGSALPFPTKKVQALLAYLALQSGCPHVRDTLTGLLWGDTGEAQARQSLRNALSSLRKVVPPPGILIDRETVILNPRAVDVDAVTFERLVAEGTPEAVERAVSLYRGDLLQGFSVREGPFEEWLRTEQERFRELAVRALSTVLAHQTNAGEDDSAIQTAARLLALDPFHEAAHRALMGLYARQGRRGAALRQYQVCVSVLQRELGVEPEEETKRVYQKLLPQRGPTSLTSHLPSGQQTPPPRRRAVRARPEILSREIPLIGRGREMAGLREALGEAWRGRGRIAVVLGEAGVGKSRLVEELAAEAFQRGARVSWGRSYELEQLLPFRPWVDAFRSAGLVSSAAELVDLNPVWRAELIRLFPEWAAPGLAGAADPADYLRLFEAVAQLIGHLTAQRPLLLILEDLHWADEMSLRLLSFLCHRVPAWSVLLVATAREEELADTRVVRGLVEQLDRELRSAKLTLPPLSRPDTEVLMQALASTDSGASMVARLAQDVWRLSEGNPFVVVESVRALQQGSMAQTPSGLSPPQRVREVIAGRLDRLSGRARGLLEVAAVIGREFEFALLQQASGLGDHDAAEGVEELVQRRVLHDVGERFDFTHERIREVAYGQLLQPRRRLLHGAVATAVERLYAGNLEDHAAALGVHFQEAGVWDKALTYLRQAGAQALARSANREAARSFEPALAALHHLPETPNTLEQAIDLRFDLRTALYPLGEFSRILGYLRDAERLAGMLDDRRRLGWASVYMSHYLWLTGQPTEARTYAERAQLIAETLGNFPLRVAANYYLGVSSHTLGHYGQARDFLQKTAETLEGNQNRERFGLHGFPAVLSRAWLAGTLAERGEFHAGIAHGQEAVRIAQELDHPHSLIVAYRFLAYLCCVKGDLGHAVELSERGVALSRDWSLTVLAPFATASLGYAYALSGRVAEGLALLQQALTAYESIGMGTFDALGVVHLGEAYLLASRLEDARATLGRALTLTRKRGQRGYEAWAHRLLGETASHLDPPDLKNADEAYHEALALAEELGMRPLAARCHLGLGKLFRRTGDRPKAQEHLTTAAALFREMDIRLWLEQAAAELKAMG